MMKVGRVRQGDTKRGKGREGVSEREKKEEGREERKVLCVTSESFSLLNHFLDVVCRELIVRS